MSAPHHQSQSSSFTLKKVFADTLIVLMVPLGVVNYLRGFSFIESSFFFLLPRVLIFILTYLITDFPVWFGVLLTVIPLPVAYVLILVGFIYKFAFF